MAMNVVTRRGVRITLACRVFEISEPAIDSVGNAHVQLKPSQNKRSQEVIESPNKRIKRSSFKLSAC
jgi:hypothetical protein